MFDWTRISLLESTTNLKPRIQALSGRKPSSGVAKDVAVCLQQGRLFYLSGAESALEIRPLLLYYGTMAFAKALVLASRCQRLAELSQSHGVRDVSSGASRLLELRVQIGDAGTFQHFNDVVAGLNRYRWMDHLERSQSLSLPTAPSPDLKGLALCLDDILSRITMLHDVYVRTVGDAALTQMVTIEPWHVEENRYQLSIWRHVKAGEQIDFRGLLTAYRARFPVLANWAIARVFSAYGSIGLTFVNVAPASWEADYYARPSGEGEYLAAVSALKERPPIPIEQALTTIYAGSNQWLAAPIQGRYLSLYSLHFLGMFLLSSLVRYRPQTWVHAVTRSSTREAPADDRALALIESFMDAHTFAIADLVAETIDPTR